jgi:hypothetical protein
MPDFPHSIEFPKGVHIVSPDGTIKFVVGMHDNIRFILPSKHSSESCLVWTVDQLKQSGWEVKSTDDTCPYCGE